MPDPEPYIPLTRTEAERLARTALPDDQHAAFDTFCRILRAWFHYEQHGHMETQKSLLAPLLEGDASPATVKRFASSLEVAALAANFRPISEAKLSEALAEESMFRIRLAVDFDQFEEVVFYGRGAEQRQATVPVLFGLRKEEVTFTNYERVLVFIRFRNVESLEPALRGQTILKLFANVPQADLEMLFPNSEIRMRLTDKLFIGVPAFISGLVVLFTKLGSALLLTGGLLAFWVGLSDRQVELDQAALVGLLSAAGALGGYLWKQFSNFKNRKIRFMKALTERLYFKNLDNNAGVLTALADHAEEAECKETVLAYAALLAGGPQTATALKSRVETMLGQARVDFDIADAISKLQRLELMETSGETLSAVPLERSITVVDARWDALFSG